MKIQVTKSSKINSTEGEVVKFNSEVSQVEMWGWKGWGGKRKVVNWRWGEGYT